MNPSRRIRSDPRLPSIKLHASGQPLLYCRVSCNLSKGKALHYRHPASGEPRLGEKPQYRVRNRSKEVKMPSFLCGKTLSGILCGLALLVPAAGASSRLAWTSYVGDRNETQLVKIAVDAAGNTYAVGNRVFRSRQVVFSPYPTPGPLVVERR
jgi:hypothetical protein